MENDAINHPSHYTQGKIEVLDFILDQGFRYLAGNIIKYVCRYRYKGSPFKDLKKARFYLDRLIKELENENTAVGRLVTTEDTLGDLLNKGAGE